MTEQEQPGKLRLELVDVYGDRIGGSVDISLRHQVLNHGVQVNGLDAGKKLMITGLHTAPQGLYALDVDPSAYLPVRQFVTIKASGFTDRKLVFPIDPEKVVDVNFQEYGSLDSDLRSTLEKSDAVMSFEGLKGEALYASIDDLRKACLMNLAAKCGATRLSNGRTVLPYIQKIRELRGERFFADVTRELREETKHSESDGVFRPVSGALHTPPAGFQSAGSWKTGDQYGNLQLTFFAKGDEWVADIDIDDAAGIEHVFQVLNHKLTGSHTHPYAVHEILIARQEIDPGYRFVV
jgi:hypothetical protein